MLFIQTNINGKNSQKQPLTDLLQNRKAYIFIKKETPTHAFCCDYCEILNIIWILIELFCRIWVQNWHFSYFLYCCFHTKIFRKCDFLTHYNIGSSTILIELLKFRNNSIITVTSWSDLLWKLLIWVPWILCFLIISLEVVLQGVAINNPAEKQIDAEIQATLKHAQASKLTEGKM